MTLMKKIINLVAQEVDEAIDSMMDNPSLKMLDTTTQ